MKTKKYFIVIVILFSSCFTTTKVDNTQLVKVANFTFQPPVNETPKANNVSFVLINPNYATNFEYTNYSPFSDFAKSMAQDINSIITSRGFSIFGPYETSDLLVYSDKKNSDIILEISIEPEINHQNVLANSTTSFGITGTPSVYYTYNGTAIIKGKVNMTIMAVWNKEKLWVKSIPMEQKSIIVNSISKYPDRLFINGFSYNDPGIINPFVEVMETYYKTIMQTVYTYLDPEEMKSIKAEADEIKAKYQK